MDIVTGTKRTSRDLRNASRFAVLRGIYSLGTPTRNELAQVAGLSFATVSTIVNELVQVDLLREASREDSGGGRPRARLELNAERGLLLGVDVAETYIHIDVFDLALNRVARYDHEISDATREPETVTDEIVTGLTHALVEHPGREVLGVGVSLPGQVEPLSGVSLFAPNWGWTDVPVQLMLQERLDLPIHVDNPLKATTVAEVWFGHGREVADLVTVNLGTGVGAGIAIDGQLIRGVTNNAGEWGHTTLVMDGRLCRCGRLGCVEAYIGVLGLMAQFAERYPGHAYLASGSQSAFIKALSAGLADDEPEAIWMIEVFAHALGSALANLVNIINPQRIVLSSWISLELSPWMLPLTERRMRSESIVGSAAVVELVLSSVPGSPVALGMATLALENFLERAGLMGRPAVMVGSTSRSLRTP